MGKGDVICTDAEKSRDFITKELKAKREVLKLENDILELEIRNEFLRENIKEKIEASGLRATSVGK